MSGFDLAYVALAVKDVERVARTLVDDMHLDHARAVMPDGRMAPAFRLGASAGVLFALDDPFLLDAEGDQRCTPGVHHIALAAADPRNAAQSAGLSLATGQTGARPGINETNEALIDLAATDGVRLRFCQPPKFDFIANTDEPPIVERIDHIGVASRDNEAAASIFNDSLDCPIESTQTDLELNMALECFTSDKYGVVYHSRKPEPVAGLRVSFITVGDCELEFLQPFDASGVETAQSSPSGDPHRPDTGQPGNTRGDKGAIGRYIERRGPGLHHLALKTPDIDGALKRLSESGHEVIDTVGRSGSRRARIGFVHPRSLGGLLMHFVERDA